LRHDKDYDFTRARGERCGHRIDPLPDGCAPDLGADTALPLVTCLPRCGAGREPSLPRAGSAGTNGGMCPVWLSGVEVCRSRCIYRLGSNGARTQPAAYNQQHAISYSVLGSGSAFGQPCTGADHPKNSLRLASEVWTSCVCTGDLCGSLAIQGNLLPRG